MEMRFLHRSRSVPAKMSFDTLCSARGKSFNYFNIIYRNADFNLLKRCALMLRQALCRHLLFNLEDTLGFQNICQSFDLII